MERRHQLRSIRSSAIQKRIMAVHHFSYQSQRRHCPVLGKSISGTVFPVDSCISIPVICCFISQRCYSSHKEYISMIPFSDVFSSYFYKHFPQWRGLVSLENQMRLRILAQDLTNKQDCKQVWVCLEEMPFLLNYFSQHVQLFLSPPSKPSYEKMAFIWIGIILLCIGIGVLFREKITSELSNVLCLAIGIFGSCLKTSCQVRDP